jgi:hypothetical protein
MAAIFMNYEIESANSNNFNIMPEKNRLIFFKN